MKQKTWQENVALLTAQGKNIVPAQLCEDAPWHFDPPSVSSIGGKQPSELTVQASINKAVQRRFDCIVSAVPNGGARTKGAQWTVKTEGIRAGYPDLIIDGIGKNAGRVFRAEIKAGAGVSVHQYGVLSMLHDNGHHCGVFRSPDTLITELERRGWT